MSRDKIFKLSAEEIKDNYDTLIEYIEKYIPSRSNQIIDMLEDLGAERLAFAPASTTEYFHNAIPGGYVDHILRVIKFSIKEMQCFKELGLKIDNFTIEELIFAALNHDLGKLGFTGDGNELYKNNESEWHRNNLGQIYKKNENIPNMPIQDRSLFLLQKYSIKCSLNEWIAIRIHDGVFDESNKSYWINFKLDSKLRSNLPLIIHNADMKAARFEFERWNEYERKINLNFIDVETNITSNNTINDVIKPESLKNSFDKIFGK